MSSRPFCRPSRFGCLMALATGALPATAAAQWAQASAFGPPARNDHALAYDSHRGCTVMFGGAAFSPALADTWEWDGTRWQQKLPAVAPPARTGHAMAYDSIRGRTVLF